MKNTDSSIVGLRPARLLTRTHASETKIWPLGLSVASEVSKDSTSCSPKHLKYFMPEWPFSVVRSRANLFFNLSASCSFLESNSYFYYKLRNRRCRVELMKDPFLCLHCLWSKDRWFCGPISPVRLLYPVMWVLVRPEPGVAWGHSASLFSRPDSTCQIVGCEQR